MDGDGGGSTKHLPLHQELFFVGATEGGAKERCAAPSGTAVLVSSRLSADRCAEFVMASRGVMRPPCFWLAPEAMTAAILQLRSALPEYVIDRLIFVGIREGRSYDVGGCSELKRSIRSGHP